MRSKNYHKNISVLIFCLFLWFPFVSHASEPDVQMKDEIESDLYSDLYDVWGIKDQIHEMVEFIASNLPVEERSDFMITMYKILDSDKVKGVSVSTMRDVFTQEDLDIMHAYYASESGKAVEQKRKDYHQLLTPKLQAIITEGMEESLKK